MRGGTLDHRGMAEREAAAKKGGTGAPPQKILQIGEQALGAAFLRSPRLILDMERLHHAVVE